MTPNNPQDSQFQPGYGQQGGQAWPPAPSGGYVQEPFENTSGTDGPIPTEVERCKFNWGAFGLTGLWLLSHKRILAGSMLILIAVSLNVLERFVSKTFGIAGFVLFGYYIWMGFVGHKLAWRSRRFDSLEQYFAVERTWTNWAIGILIGSFIFILLAITLPLMIALRGH